MKTAVVTGGSKGIGKACVDELVEMGYFVHYSYLTTVPNDTGYSTKALQADVRNYSAMKEWIDSIDKIDVLVNNAGIAIDKSILNLSIDDWHRVLNINLTGAFYLTKSCALKFIRQGFGNIINISSVSGLVGAVGQANYSASKGGLNSLTKVVAKELANFGGRCNAICAGIIDTDMIKNSSCSDAIERVAKYVPLKRMGTVKEIAHAMRFLIENEYITGQLLQVDGGLVI